MAFVSGAAFGSSCGLVGSTLAVFSTVMGATVVGASTETAGRGGTVMTCSSASAFCTAAETAGESGAFSAGSAFFQTGAVLAGVSFTATAVAFVSGTFFCSVAGLGAGVGAASFAVVSAAIGAGGETGVAVATGAVSAATAGGSCQTISSDGVRADGATGAVEAADGADTGAGVCTAMVGSAALSFIQVFARDVFVRGATGVLILVCSDSAITLLGGGVTGASGESMGAGPGLGTCRATGSGAAAIAFSVMLCCVTGVLTIGFPTTGFCTISVAGGVGLTTGVGAFARLGGKGPSITGGKVT